MSASSSSRDLSMVSHAVHGEARICWFPSHFRTPPRTTPSPSFLPELIVAMCTGGVLLWSTCTGAILADAGASLLASSSARKPSPPCPHSNHPLLSLCTCCCYHSPAFYRPLAPLRKLCLPLPRQGTLSFCACGSSLVPPRVPLPRGSLLCSCPLLPVLVSSGSGASARSVASSLPLLCVLHSPPLCSGLRGAGVMGTG